MKSIISNLNFSKISRASRKNKSLLFLGLVAVLVLIYLFAPIEKNFVTSPQLFTTNENGSLYLPASSGGSTCSGNSCVSCDPDHASCDSCPGNCVSPPPPPICGLQPCGSCADSRYRLDTCDGSCLQYSECIQPPPPPPPPGNPAPIGFHVPADCTASYGWTCDASDYSVPLAVHFYADGPAGSGTLIGATTANIPAEPGVAAACGGFANHRFQFLTPDTLKTGTNRSIYAYAIDYPSANQNPLLTSSPQTINCLLPPPAPTASISADSTLIVYNTATTIRWSSTNATSCTVSPPGWTGTSGAQSTGPLTTATTYTVNCSGAGGSASASVTVNIQPPGGFSLSLGGAVACNSVPLSWTVSSGAEAYRILRGSPRVDISPYQPYTALNFTDSSVSQNTTYQYQIEAYNTGGTNRSNEISVTTPFCPPTLNFSADRTSIFQGQSVILSWNTTYVNLNSCTASSVPTQSSWSGTKAANDSQTVVPLPPPSVTYNLQCSGPGGTSPLRSVIINITSLALPEFREIIPR